MLEDQRTYDVLVRFDDAARQSVETIASHADRHADRREGADRSGRRGARRPGAEHDQPRERAAADHRSGQRRRPRSRLRHRRRPSSDQRATCRCPQGYFVQYGGQFEAQEKAARQITMLSVVAIAGIFLLLYIALRSARLALLVMANLPLALIGGVVMVFLSGGTLSIASLIGFITLFGIATRNGIMLITPLPAPDARRKASRFRDAIVQGSLERLSPILMTALVTGVGLIPLALGAGEPGKEIQQPMAVVILGGIVTSTFLNMIVIPALYLKYGGAEALVKTEDYPRGPGLVTRA